MIPDRARDHNPARLCQRFESRGNIDAVSIDVIRLHDHVAGVYPDPECQAIGGRNADVALGGPVLNLHRTAACLDHTRELREEAVAGVLDQNTATGRDGGFDQLATERGPTRVRALLVAAHEPAVARDIREDDRGQLPLYG